LFSIIFNQHINRKFLSFNLFLIFEPILLFTVADTSYPQLRYFGLSIFLLYILFGFMIKSKISNDLNINNFVLSITCLILLFFLYEKISILNYSRKILDKGHAQYKVLDDYNSSTKTLFFTSYMTYRANIETLNLYKMLISKKLVSLNPDADNKNSINEIEKKIKYISQIKNLKIKPSSEKNIFIGGELIISDNINSLRTISNILQADFNLRKLKKIENIGFSTIIYRLN